MKAASSGTRFDNTRYPFGLQLLGCNAQLLLWPFTSSPCHAFLGCAFVKFRTWPGPSASLSCGANGHAKHRVLDGLFFCLTRYVGKCKRKQDLLATISWVILTNTAMWTSSPWSQDRVLWQNVEQLHSVRSYDITWKGLPNHSWWQMSSSDSDPKTNYKNIPLRGYFRYIITSGISPALHSIVHLKHFSTNKRNICVAPAPSSMYQQFTIALQTPCKIKITIRHVLVDHFFISQFFLNLPAVAWTMRRLSTRPFNFALS